MNTLRKNISILILDALFRVTEGQSIVRIGIPHLARESGVPINIIETAITHGIVELGDFAAICRALDLDPADALREAINHVGSDLAQASASSANSAVNPAEA